MGKWGDFGKLTTFADSPPATKENGLLARVQTSSIFAGRAGDWLGMDSETLTAATAERIPAQLRGLTDVAVYPDSDHRISHPVMATLELGNGNLSNLAAFGSYQTATRLDPSIEIGGDSHHPWPLRNTQPGAGQGR
jgi:hypothetical protein